MMYQQIFSIPMRHQNMRSYFHFIGRRIIEAESEFSRLELSEDEIIKSVYENSNTSNHGTNLSVIRSDGGSAKDNSVANPNLDTFRPQVVYIFVIKINVGKFLCY